MTTKPTKTVPATCACGASFQREVKRGRPQVWCPKCREVSFYERPACHAGHDVSFPVVESGTVETVSERIVNQNDPLDAVRAEVEAGMALINVEHKVRFAAMLAEGGDPMDVAVRAQAETFAATTELYGQYRKTKVMMPKDEDA